jgi:CxxC-x17-CxxC domain-containing protein
MSVGEGEKLRDLEITGSEANSEFTDQSIVCIDCHLNFIWTAGEQAFYRDKCLLNPPKRCKPCKKRKNERLAAIEVAQTTGQPHRIEVAAECACCSTVTTVPFYPSQGRPVYCRSCYQKQNGGSSHINGSSS